MKNFLPLLILIGFACKEKESAESGYGISKVDIKEVAMADSFWLPKIKVIQDSTIQYAFEKCRQEGRMENFLIAGGVKKGKVFGKMPFDDTDLYKIIEGASYSLISKPNPALDAYLDSVIAIIKKGQEPDGYLTTWFTIDRLHPPANWVKPSHARWENEISSHELYNSGHLFEAAAAHYEATGKKNLLEIATRNADLLVENFGPGKLTKPPGHQIAETGLIRLYEVTGRKKYLELAKFLLDIRGDSTTHQLYGAYNQDHIQVTKQKEAVGHAVRAEYMYAAMTDIAAIYGDTAYRHAVLDLWDNVVNRKMYVTGGLGARHEGESFGNDYELPNLTAYSETCAAIGSVYWNQRMFLLTGDSKYYDVLERTLYNGVIAGISVSGKEFFYPNPLESDGKYTFNMGACTRQAWFDCSCCPTNLIRFIPAIPGLIYATRQDSLYVNLYASNHATLDLNKNRIHISQQTNYPWDGKIDMTVEPEQPMTFNLKLRIPGWSQNRPVPGNLYHYKNAVKEEVKLLVNGKASKILLTQGYASITREWSAGDKIELILPMDVKRVVTNERVQSNNDAQALELGPIVYCAEEADNKNFSTMRIKTQETFEVGKKKILSNTVSVIQGSDRGEQRVFIPYYLWSNRGVGQMKVWLPTED